VRVVPTKLGAEVDLEQHPLERSDVLTEVKALTRALLAQTRGTGKVSITIELDFKDRRLITYRLLFGGASCRRVW
jgi:hypothetical protein